MNKVVYSTSTDRYALAERNSPSQYTRKCINGKITGCSNCVGYCQYEGHPGFLTKELRQKHDCIGKECYHFIPKPTREKNPTTKVFDISDIVKAQVKEFEGMRILRANLSTDGLWTIHYVAISNDYPLDKIAEAIEQETGIVILWNKLNYSFDKCVTLIMNN